MDVAAANIAAGDRRTYSRFDVKIYGRFMLEDHSEHSCQVMDISPASVALRADRPWRSR